MHRRRAWAAAIALSLLAACGSDAVDPAPEAGAAGTTTDAAADTTTATGGDTSTSTSASSDSAEPTDASTVPDATAPTATETTSDGAATTSGGAAGGASAATGGATDGSAQPARPGVPTGTYRYDVEGSSQVGTLEPQRFKAEVTTQVAPVAADGTQTEVATTRFVEGSSPRSLDESRTLRHSADEIFLVRLLTQGSDDEIEFLPEPPPLFTPVDPAEGRSWSWTMTSTDGSTTVDVTATARGRETLTVGGTPVSTVITEARLVFTSEDFEGTQDLTTWFDPTRRLAVRQEGTMNGRARVGGVWFAFSSEDTRLLRSLQPA